MPKKVQPKEVKPKRKSIAQLEFEGRDKALDDAKALLSEWNDACIILCTSTDHKDQTTFSGVKVGNRFAIDGLMKAFNDGLILGPEDEDDDDDDAIYD